MHPGEGAIEYARELTDGMTSEEAAIIFTKMLDELSEDTRIKLCAVCGYPFRDKTKPRNTKVCGWPCTKTKKTVQRRVQRTGRPNIKVKIHNKYIWWLEYPFWLSEYAMINHVWSHEKPHEDYEDIYAARMRDEAMGGRRKAIVEYSEYE